MCKQISHLVYEVEVEDFYLEHILECGQAFRWYKLGPNFYLLISGDKVCLVKQDALNSFIIAIQVEADLSYWLNYFDLQSNYAHIKKSISRRGKKVMREACDYGFGLRIARQDHFETLIVFIISANNNMKRIQRSLFLLSEHYGKAIELAPHMQALLPGEYKNIQCYAFPDAHTLASIEADELRALAGVGYRDKNLILSAKMVAEHTSLESLSSLSTNKLLVKLQEFPGVGPKVAACIALFAYHRTNAFPVDVWIKRTMQNLYLDETASSQAIALEGQKRFGRYSGIAQQYLFYFAKELDKR